MIAMKCWKVTAELDMDASCVETTYVKANTARKAEIFAEQKFKKLGHFMVRIMKIEEENC